MGIRMRRTLGPLFLLTVCPVAVIVFLYTAIHLDGSFEQLFAVFKRDGVWRTIVAIWSPVFWGTQTSWTILGVFGALQFLLLRFLPGKPFKGPVTQKGFAPSYKQNGFFAFVITLFFFGICSWGFGFFSPTIIFDHFGELISSLCIMSLIFCLFLYIKGRTFPSSPDHSTTGNFIFDYYWGTELYPKLFGVSVKQFTNCRFGLMSWGLIIISFAAKQYQLYGYLSNSMLISVSLQLLYIGKFFLWEKGYLRSLDIMHDRAGFYICWGCFVWVPGVYTSTTLYLVMHPNHLSLLSALAITGIGMAAILINYWADRQRMVFREKLGQSNIWGRQPIFTRARFTTADGQEQENLLLASGFWGIGRHFHYLPELVGALCWSLPALFSNFFPYFYVCFLTLLLLDRADRDDKRCQQKYGTDWQEHMNKVPYRFIPHIY